MSRAAGNRRTLLEKFEISSDINYNIKILHVYYSNNENSIINFM